MSSPGLGSHLVALLMPVGVTVLIPWWLASVFPTSHASAGMLVVGVTLIVASLGLFAWTLALFVRVGRGTLAPWDATKELVIVGPYRYVRNPMISAVFGILIGESLAFASVAILIWALILYTVNTVYFIAVEERGLSRRFGASYGDYKKAVRRWLPRARPYVK